jgi:preprotein translocase subunit SecG
MLIDGVLLTIVVLLQSGKGDGLAAMGGGMGTDTLIGGRQAATILTKATWTTGGLFLFFALVLAVLSSRAQRPNSILREEFKPTTQQNAPAPLQVPGTQPATQQSAGQKPAAQQPAAKQPATAPAQQQPKK